MVKAHSTAETPPIEVTCFYEELPVLGVGLVGRPKPDPFLNTDARQ